MITISQWYNQKGDRALVAYTLTQSGEMEVYRWIADNSRLRSLRSFNNFGPDLAEYSEEAWENQVKEFVLETGRRL